MKMKLLHGACLLCLLAAASAPGALADDDDRMAGSSPVSVARPEKKDAAAEENPAAAAKPEEKTAAAPPSGNKDESGDESGDENRNEEAEKNVRLPSDIDELESTGVYEGPWKDRLWSGLAHADIEALLREAPNATPYASVNGLVRRLLLSRSNASRIGGKPEPGRDLLTLRLEKLMEAGAFAEAADLYKAMNAEPYHERLAQAGMLALLHSRQPAIACIEQRIMQKRGGFGSHGFWPAVSRLCDYIMTGKPQTGVDGGKVLKKTVADKNFRYTLRKPGELGDIAPLERAALFADDRIGYENFSPFQREKITPAAISLVLADPNLPQETRLDLFPAALRKGIRTKEDLADWYKSINFPAIKEPSTTPQMAGTLENWKKLPFLYQLSARDDEATSAKLAGMVLSLLRERGAEALELGLPFAAVIAETDPSALPAESIRPALRLMAESGQKMPLAWQKKLSTLIDKENDAPRKKDLLMWVAARLDAPAEVESKDLTPYFSLETSGFSENEQKILKIVYEKLDKLQELHNYTNVNGDNPVEGLTVDDDYVMQFKSLIERLEKARSEKRIGEVVLLSSVILRDMPPATIKADVLAQVVDAYISVGLTNEARELTEEVLLGLSR